jgi:hypothetical protein
MGYLAVMGLKLLVMCFTFTAVQVVVVAAPMLQPVVVMVVVVLTDVAVVVGVVDSLAELEAPADKAAMVFVL